MFRFRVILAVFVCKFARFVLRIVKSGGTALPGKIAVRICPDLLTHLAKNVRCTAITGTNGKTTCARMLEQCFIDSGASCFSNKSGSNLMQGITAEFALHSTVTGKPRKKFAIIECDEAASKEVFPYLNPEVLLITNVFRDQGGVIGSVMDTLENIKTGVSRAARAVVCLNADDPLISSLSEEIPNRTVFFGVSPGVLKPDETLVSAGAISCVRCGCAYEYDYITYGHLGGFRCPDCGCSRREPEFSVDGLISRGEDSQTVKVRMRDITADITLNIPGDYNIYNAAGVIAAADLLGFTADAVGSALRGFERGFGRMETLTLGGLPARIILIKNPVGGNQVINYLTESLTESSGDIILVFCLNDKIADGSDISWICDVNFEKLREMGGKLRSVLVTGSRADDLAERIRNALPSDGLLKIFKNMESMIDYVLDQGTPVCFIPNYTSMLELRSVICRRFGVKNYWEL